MAKRENDLRERTLAQKLDGVGDKIGAAELGKRSKVTPARPPKKGAPPPAPIKHVTLAERNAPAKVRPAPVDPAAEYARRLSTDLHARSGHPTLAERVAAEGFSAYTGNTTKAKAKK